MRKFTLSLFIAVVFSAWVNAADFTVEGYIYNYDGTVGSPATPNSFAYLYGYRLGVDGQILEHSGGQQITPCVSPNKVFASDGSIPSYYNTSADGAWNASPAALAEGQIARVILQVSATGNCYLGAESYVSCASKIILLTEINASGMTLPDCQLKIIPSPSVAQQTSNSISINWTGIDLDNVEGYNIYRDENGSGNYLLLANASQDRGNMISYTDTDVSLAQGSVYTYKISVRFIWGGGNGAPDYFETIVKSKKSAGAQLLPPTYTITPTHTAVMNSPTQTQTHTLTETQTFTPTLTQTASFTQTYTDTYTMTSTVTDTMTATYTATSTPTVTVTLTVSSTATVTMTSVATFTPTIIPALIREKVLVFNNPVRNSRVVLAFLAPSTGQAVIDFYNINAELVRRYKVSADYGPNNFSADFKGVSPGVYIIRINVNGNNLPERKVAIIK